MNIINTLEKKLEERNVIIASIVSAGIMLVFSFVALKLYGDLVTDIWTMSKGQIFGEGVIIIIGFLLNFVLTIVVGGMLIYMRANKRPRELNIYGIVVFSIQAFLLLITAKYFTTTVSIAFAGQNSDSLYNAMEAIYSAVNGIGVLRFAIVVEIVLLVIAILLFVKGKEIINIITKSATAQLNVMAEGKNVGVEKEEPIVYNAESASESIDNSEDEKNIEPVDTTPKEPRKPMSKKTKGIIIGCVVVCILAFGGYKVWDTFFNFTEVSLIDNVEDVKFEGYDGMGEASGLPNTNNIDYDVTNPDMLTFLDTVSYSFDKDESLSNGDKVTVIAKYSEETAKTLKIKVVNDKKSVKVSGLIERYKDGKDIDKEFVKALLTKANDIVKEESSLFSGEIKNPSLVKIYYYRNNSKDDDNYGPDDNIQFVYTYKDEEKKTKYKYVRFRYINKNTKINDYDDDWSYDDNIDNSEGYDKIDDLIYKEANGDPYTTYELDIANFQ